ncbi:MAG TPA: phosphoribosylamine--glycine ligase [Candidatus Saccharimonadales bacterium]|jgi:phosphoribosylamine--glycine ligase|nr:phosphoribosylamine--glycine ligase [Candidatus Saccharimonadales bacterium]
MRTIVNDQEGTMAGIDVLVVGSGGREYELARQMARSKAVRKLYVAPGNAGTARLDKTENIPLSPDDVNGIILSVSEHRIAAVIIGPDAAIAAGLGNALRAVGVPVFGPTQEAGKLESSKAFAAGFMQRHDIPQPEYWTAHTEQEALNIIKDKAPETYVLKADGLAAGKGVVLPQTADEAITAVADMFSGQGFGGAGKSGVVIQERLHGPEVSAFAVSDGKNIVMLPFSQDHKRLKNNDTGPITGGVGAYSPLPESIVAPGQAQKINDIAQRSIQGMAEEHTPYQGVLYLGLMLAEERGGDPVIIEYNARFGDPETQVVLPVLNEAGVDVADMLLRAARGDISDISVPDHTGKAVLTVCLSAAGYPENPMKGDEIHGLDAVYEDVIVQQAGTKQDGDKIVTAGGRVLYITGVGDTIDEAAAKAYSAIGKDGIHFKGMQFRTDIGHQARK